MGLAYPACWHSLETTPRSYFPTKSLRIICMISTPYVDGPVPARTSLGPRCLRWPDWPGTTAPGFDLLIQGHCPAQFLGSAERRFSIPAWDFQGAAAKFRQAWSKTTARSGAKRALRSLVAAPRSGSVGRAARTYRKQRGSHILHDALIEMEKNRSVATLCPTSDAALSSGHPGCSLKC